MFDIYKLEQANVPNNNFFIDRSETWIQRLDCTLYSEEEAKEYVLRMNLKHAHDMVNIGHSIQDMEQRQLFYNEFCFDDKYQYMRKYFIGKPNVSLIKAQLKSHGIRMVMV
jgi:hypothetical protein